ncbi:MAG TPA: enoyl-CoA hydratase-related protein [Candidatus Thermoplasmatota archaeon]|nr:enoyl-CoA hydratase-related protein [Candidatus Thermoplasmatota archaeon]
MTQALVSAEEPVIKLEKRDGVAIVTVNRPKNLNAINAQVMTELGRVFSDLEAATDVFGIILTGAGDKAFIAGADIAAMANLAPDAAREWGRGGQALLAGIERLPKPVIAAVNGYALGGGLEIAMACDFIVAAPEAKMGQPEVLLGVIPGFGGTQRLARLVGKAKAKQLCMMGEQITAQEGHRLGLVAEVVPRAELVARSEAILRKIHENGPVAVRLVKDVINHGVNMDLDSGCLLELDAFALCFSTQDQKEGMRAFLEKRKPRFVGR